MPDGDWAVASAGLTKRFGAVAAVDDVDLAVPRGAVYGFLGPNGSGKTTTIRMLLGLVFPSAGRASLLGVDTAAGVPARAALAQVGALVEGPAFHPYLSGVANLRRLDAADRTADPRTSRARVAAALDRVGLAAAAGKRYRAYSLGMRQRLGIAGALLRPRELLMLDEPTNGLDPQGTREVRTLITQLADDGVTVFVSSHLLSEIDQVCSDVGVMSAGRLVWQGPLARLRAQQTPRVRVETADVDLARRVLGELGVRDLADLVETPGVSGVAAGAEPADAGQLAAGQAVAGQIAGQQIAGQQIAAEQIVAEQIVAALVRAGVGVRGFAVQRASLEEQFVGLTGEGFDVSG